MPANLTPQYLKAEDEFKRAATPADRLEKLREAYRLLPKHKGTEKLQAELKQKISRARDEAEGARPGAKKSSAPGHRVPREGAGQVALVGPPNAGKSALLAAMTNAKPEVAPYPFTTRAPQPGMLRWEDVAVQLVELPALAADVTEPWVAGLLRSADAAILVVDLADDDLLEGAQGALDWLRAARVEPVGALPADGGDDEARIFLPAAAVANKLDAPGAADRLEVAREWAEGAGLACRPASAIDGTGLDAVGRLAYDLLGVIRVYTKVPGRPADRTHPFTLPAGGTVLDLARQVHRDLERSLKFAKVWGTGPADGRSVGRDHELRDADLVELHA